MMPACFSVLASGLSVCLAHTSRRGVVVGEGDVEGEGSGNGDGNGGVVPWIISVVLCRLAGHPHLPSISSV